MAKQTRDSLAALGPDRYILQRVGAMRLDLDLEYPAGQLDRAIEHARSLGTSTLVIGVRQRTPDEDPRTLGYVVVR